jgi:hypothetical protein
VGLGEEKSPTASPAGTAPLSEKICITAADDPWAQEIADRLGQRYPLVRVFWPPVGLTIPPAFPAEGVVRVDVDRPEALRQALSGSTLVLHLLPERSGQSVRDWVEEATRRTYQLLQAAAGVGVKACLLLSTLNMLEAYDPDFLVDEDWQPQPDVRGRGLAEYLAEFVCREFAREKLLRVLVVRIGRLQDRFPQGEEARGSAWTLRQDALVGIERAVDLLLGKGAEVLPWWTVVHVAGASPPARFPSRRAQKLLGYQPSPYPG